MTNRRLRQVGLVTILATRPFEEAASLGFELRHSFVLRHLDFGIRVEYRHRTPYWRRRLEGRHYDVIQFRNGYASNAPEMLVEWRGLRRYGTARSGYYAIRLGRILKIKRWRK